MHAKTVTHALSRRTGTAACFVATGRKNVRPFKREIPVLHAEVYAANLALPPPCVPSPKALAAADRQAEMPATEQMFALF